MEHAKTKIHACTRRRKHTNILMQTPNINIKSKWQTGWVVFALDSFVLHGTSVGAMSFVVTQRRSLHVHMSSEVNSAVTWLLQCTRDGAWEHRGDLNFVSLLFTGRVLACVLSLLLHNNHYGYSSGMRVKYNIKVEFKHVDFSCCMNSWCCIIFIIFFHEQ